MALLNLVTAPDPFLKNKSEDVQNFDINIQRFMDDLKDTMYAERGVGLAAVQVGVLKNIIVIDMQDLKDENEIVRDEKFYPLFLVNPKVIKKSENKILAAEGCLSLPEQRVELARPEKVTITYHDYNNKEQTLDADGWLARAVQHEMDHLEGKLLIDYLSFLKRDIAIKKLGKIKNSKDL